MIKNEDVTAAFDEVAPRYDLMVALNPGYHAHLRSAAHALVEWLPGPALRAAGSDVSILDLGCGSGASTRAVLQAAQAAGLRSSIVGVDASLAMLEQARAKQWPAGVRFEMGQAEKIAWSRYEWELDDPIDGVFSAYLFRNVADRDAVLAGLFDCRVPTLDARGMERGVLAGGHSPWLADLSANPAVSLPVAQRAVLRLD